MKLTREQLYADLHAAYIEARKHKRSRDYQQQFERDMYWQLKYLCDELYERRYTPQPATCFTICDPKKREIVAAEFRDRIVHHLYYSYTHQLFERTFIEDAYSCIESRGTHYGVKRLQQHIREESQNYTRPCYVLKMDILGIDAPSCFVASAWEADKRAAASLRAIRILRPRAYQVHSVSGDITKFGSRSCE